MADEPTPTPPLQPVPLIYANAMFASAGGVDLSMDFGYRSADGQVTMGARVVMTWEHAQLMHEVLGTLLERYEAEIGEIRDVKKVAEIRVIGPGLEGGEK